MGAYRQALLHDFTTCVAFLRGETRVHSDHLMTSSCSLLLKDSEECAPASVHDALCQGMILDHVENTQVLNSDKLIAFCIRLGRLIVKITALTGDLEMGLSRTAGSLTASVASLFASAQLALFASQCLLRRAIETRVLNGPALRVSQEGFQAHINTDVRMSAVRWSMCGVGFSLTDNQRVPMSISTMDEVHGLGSALYRAMEFDFKGCSQFSRDNEILVLMSKSYILAIPILSELDRVPAVRLLETREPHIRNAQLTGCEKTLERFGEPISQHLYRGGWHLLATTAFELCGQIIFRGERALLCISTCGGSSDKSGTYSRPRFIAGLAQRDSARHAMSKRACSLFGYSLNSNVLTS